MKGEQSHIGICLIRVSQFRACCFFIAQKADKYVPGRLDKAECYLKVCPCTLGFPLGLVWGK